MVKVKSMDEKLVEYAKNNVQFPSSTFVLINKFKLYDSEQRIANDSVSNNNKIVLFVCLSIASLSHDQ